MCSTIKEVMSTVTIGLRFAPEVPRPDANDSEGTVDKPPSHSLPLMYTTTNNQYPLLTALIVLRKNPGHLRGIAQGSTDCSSSIITCAPRSPHQARDNSRLRFPRLNPSGLQQVTYKIASAFVHESIYNSTSP